MFVAIIFWTISETISKDNRVHNRSKKYKNSKGILNTWIFLISSAFKKSWPSNWPDWWSGQSWVKRGGNVDEKPWWRLGFIIIIIIIIMKRLSSRHFFSFSRRLSSARFSWRILSLSSARKRSDSKKTTRLESSFVLFIIWTRRNCVGNLPKAFSYSNHKFVWFI